MASIVSLITLSILISASYDKSYDVSGQRSDDEVRSLHAAWMAEHGKTYNAGESERRFQIFKDNLRYIDEHNTLPGRSYKLGLNKLSDLTIDERRKTLLRPISRPDTSTVKSDASSYNLPDSLLPDSVDWREKGSCGAFSTIAVVEGANAIATSNLISLSEQEVLDCDTSLYTNGCGGGYINIALDYIVKNGDIDSEMNYPYIGMDGKCKQDMVS